MLALMRQDTLLTENYYGLWLKLRKTLCRSCFLNDICFPQVSENLSIIDSFSTLIGHLNCLKNLLWGACKNIYKSVTNFFKQKSSLGTLGSTLSQTTEPINGQ